MNDIEQKTLKVTQVLSNLQKRHKLNFHSERQELFVFFNQKHFPKENRIK